MAGSGIISYLAGASGGDFDWQRIVILGLAAHSRKVTVRRRAAAVCVPEALPMHGLGMTLLLC